MGAGAKAGLAAAVLVAAGLGGCGFRPLYATPGVGGGLSRVDVVAPAGRVGFLLREDLDDALGRDKSATPVWRLDMQLTQVRNARGLNVDQTAQRYELDAQVSYTLTDLATGKVAHTGHVSSAVSYDSAPQPYAGIAARQDTQDRIASDAAQKIQLDLATWMATRPAG